MNTHIDRANTSTPNLKNAKSPVTQTNTPDMHVLSEKDEALYRSIFVAQEKADWKLADSLVARLEDRRLLGHVLADRYERRTSTAPELQTWLASYSDFPETLDIYNQLKNQSSAKDAIKISKPSYIGPWSGEESYEASFGFRADADDEPAVSEQKLSHGITQALRHGNPYGAEELLYKEMTHRALASKELGDIQGQIAAGFFYAGVYDHARDVAGSALSSKNPLALWVAGLTAWKDNNIRAAADDFTILAQQPDLAVSDKTAAQFWAWRALNKLGETAKARTMLQQAATQTRSFYGLLAASLTGHNAAWSWDLPKLNAKNLAVLEKTSAGWRALALLQINQASLAEDELRRLNLQGHRDMQEAMLALAETDHMPSLAVQLGGIATADNGKRYDAALYPVPPWQPEEGFQIDRALLYALIRRESYFNPEAVSQRGACGLMQLMPQTANLMARHKVADGDDCSDRILEPAYNMGLGQKYVRRLASEPMIGTNLLYLLAAYNGGPGKLAHWTDDKTLKDPLLFVESLPMHETRNYIQQVLMHYWTYRARLSEPVTSMAALARGEWPRYALRDETRLSKNLQTAKATGYEVASNQK